jgi:hypothetical protein
VRTHLLRAVYPLPAAMAVEPDTGNASNDECFAPKNVATPLSTHPQDKHDDYYLGGYAGI